MEITLSVILFLGMLMGYNTHEMLPLDKQKQISRLPETEILNPGRQQVPDEEIEDLLELTFYDEFGPV